ncbi:MULTISPECIES: GntP family permease [unclassified Frigoribacterium]|uniref:GntP family permease n=1 Tax=unclassified Frigoribacterium TaxID=2627005 RepID=UPI000F464A9A|nr:MULTISPECIES: gluconate:H+ symporter [unclassified Frigoribacterium]ROS50123.1 GntP family gluconate:H+ symporter [Frigoribacterium sp. PhB118]
MHLLAAATAAPTPSGTDAQLIIAALVGIVVIVGLITWLKVHPFLALLLGAVGVGIGAGLAPGDAVTSFGTGFGSTMTSVGILIGLGAMFGKLLSDSGGADRIVDTLISRSSQKALPWVMALIGALIGLPMFFEVGLVLLIPVIVLVARRSGLPLMRIAIPALAGLSAMHALVPPHPGPLLAVSTVGADLGLTLGLGVLVAIPTVIVAGPLFSTLAAKWAPVPVPDLFVSKEEDGGEGSARRRPSFVNALIGILLPVVLMLARSIREAALPTATGTWVDLLEFLGTPMVALTVAVLYAMVFYARAGGMDKAAVSKTLGSSLPDVAGILLIVGAGGGFKQVLIDTGIGTVIGDAVSESGVSVLLVAWVVAALVRVATGSATVATVTAAGIMAPLAADMSTPEASLLVLAIGAGSVFLSHVNDAGFWLIKEYLGTTVGQNFRTWSLMECVLSLTALAGVMLASVFI